ncbi:hypothetical protein Isolate57625_22680 [Mycobacteroides abscessus subsp. abscessus]
MDRGAQRRVTKHDRGDRRTQLVYIEFTVEPIGPAQVHQNWRHTVCEPDTVLPRGQGHRGYTEAYRRFPAGNAHLDVTIAHGAHSISPRVFTISTGCPNYEEATLSRLRGVTHEEPR